MKNFTYYTPTKVFFGENQENNLGEILKSYNVKKVLFHYGQTSIKKSGLYDVVINQLNAAQIDYVELGGVEPNPKLSLVHKGVELCKKENVDLVLAVGGGSVIDSAKSIAHGALVDFDPWKFSIKEETPRKALPVGVILTIAAAGSEMSDSCVITNEETLEKRGFNTITNRPLFAIMNPKYTFTVSKYQTACGIVDILMHTLERFFADPEEKSQLSDSIAISLMKTVIENGKIVMADPTNYNARAELMWASSISHNSLTGIGKSFQMSVHQIEHEVSGMFDEVAHGAGLAVVWPAWAKVAYKHDLKHFKRFAYEVMEVEQTDSSENDIIASIDKIKEFFKEIGMPVTLKELNIEESNIEQLAYNFTFKGKRTVKDIFEVDYEKALEILTIAK